MQKALAFPQGLSFCWLPRAETGLRALSDDAQPLHRGLPVDRYDDQLDTGSQVSWQVEDIMAEVVLLPVQPFVVDGSVHQLGLHVLIVFDERMRNGSSVRSCKLSYPFFSLVGIFAQASVIRANVSVHAATNPSWIAFATAAVLLFTFIFW